MKIRRGKRGRPIFIRNLCVQRMAKCMKKFIFTAAFLIFALAFAMLVVAELVPVPTLAYPVPSIGVTIDGAPVLFADAQAPALIDGRVLVPVRGVFEHLGFYVDWDEDARMVTLRRIVHIDSDLPDEFVRFTEEVFITIDSDVFQYDSTLIDAPENHALEVAAQIIGGRTMLPIRALIESVGYEVGWNDAMRTVLILTREPSFEVDPHPFHDLIPETADPSIWQRPLFETTTPVLDFRPMPEFTPVTGMDMMERIAVGINIGNSMESVGFLADSDLCPITELESVWGNAPLEQWHFEAIALMGFDSVRIPINWTARMNNFVIDERWMDRVQEVVDWALQAGLYVIINTHHERDLYDPMHYGPFEDAERWLTSVWAQVSERFKYYPHALIFEPMNEPRPGLDGWFWCETRYAREIPILVESSRRLNESVLEIIRNSGGNNAQRVVMLATYQGSLDPRHFTPPENDPYIMLGGFLYPDYYPGFVRERRQLQELRTALDDGIAMVVKETSPYGMDLEDALEWSRFVYAELAELGVPTMWWNRAPGYASYELFWRNAGEWNYPIVDVLFAAYGRTRGESLPPAPIEFPHVIATSIEETGFTTWTQGDGNAVVPNVLFAADSLVVEFSGGGSLGGFSFVRWHPSPWSQFDSGDPRITQESGRIILDLRGTEGYDIGFAVWNEGDVERITRIFLE
ncbi:MAG: cellulase family glycosylhydrolase [Defluviitaleaceae bacterium]|nr:cellulase family glycosylhydrolase [Defluviitaleaceae bacterium]